MSTRAGTGTFEVLGEGQDVIPVGADDRIVVTLALVDGETWVKLPQFDDEFSAPESADLVGEAVVKHLLAVYNGLTELPDAYVTEIEEAQLSLLRRVFLPWFARVMAIYPDYFSVPPEAARSAGTVSKGDLQPA